MSFQQVFQFYYDSQKPKLSEVDFFQVEDDFKPFDHTYIIDGKYYSPCRLDLKENILVVEEFKIEGSKEDSAEHLAYKTTYSSLLRDFNLITL